MAAGNGTTAEAVGQTALITEVGTRGSGASSKSAARQFVTFPSVGADTVIREFGLLDAASAGNLWNRRLFGAITVNPGDSIQFTYTCDTPSGGAYICSSL